MPAEDIALADLPQDNESLKAMVRSLLLERNQEKERAEEQRQRAEQEQQRANALHLAHLRQQKRSDELYLEKLRLEQEAGGRQAGQTGRFLHLSNSSKAVNGYHFKTGQQKWPVQN